MKISAKGRYGLAAMVCLATSYAAHTPVTIISISNRLGISKIYLEQVFSLLKRARLVVSSKGAQGGYQLACPPHDITAYNILSAIELSLIEKTSPSVGAKSQEIEQALQSLVYQPLNDNIAAALQQVSLADILSGIEAQKPADELMYFI
jgi:Rrf2 family protein